MRSTSAIGGGAPKGKPKPKPKPKPRPVVPHKVSTQAFTRGLPSPGAGIQRAARRAGRREGIALSKLPGVRANLKPVPRGSGRAKENAREGSRRAGLTPEQRIALALAPTPQGRALRQARDAQSAPFRRAAITEGKRVSGVPEGVRLTPAERQALNTIGRAALGVGRDVVRPGRAHQRLGVGPASVDLTSLGRSVAAATSLDSGDLGPRQFVKGALDDVKTLGTGPFIGGYQVYRALSQVVPRPGHASDPGAAASELGAVGSGLVEGVKQSSPYALVTGHPGEALDRAMKHPVLAALDYAAAAGVAGRTAGAFGRGAGSNVEASGARGALARFGSTVRSPVALSSDPAAIRAGQYIERRFSMDAIRKGVQVAQDRGREVVRDQRGRPVTVVQRGRRVPVLVPTDRELVKGQRRRANHEASRANSVERLQRDRADHAFVAALQGSPGFRARVRKRVKGRKAQDLAALVIPGTIRSAKTMREDLLKRADVIEKQLALAPEHSPFRHSGERATAEANVREYRAAAADPKVLRQADRIVAAGRSLAAGLNEADAHQIALRVLDPRQAERSRLSEYALAHMDGVRHWSAADHAAAEKSARAVERAAEQAWRDAPPEGKAAARQAYGEAVKRRIAVSGRDPAGEVAYERASRKVGKTRAERRDAQRALDRAKTPEAVAKARTRLRAAEKAYREAQDARAAVKRSPVTEGLRHSDGRILRNSEIERHARENGVDPSQLAYLPHVGGQQGGRAFHQQFRPGTRARGGAQTRTGSLYQRGATVANAELVREEFARKAVTEAKVRQLDQLLADSGVRHPAWGKAERGEPLTKFEKRVVRRGGYFTASEADELAKRLSKDGEPMIAVRAHSARMASVEQDAVRAAQNPASMETAHAKLVNGRMLEEGYDKASKARNYVVMPAEEWTQLVKHVTPAGEIEKALQSLNRAFRMAVLPQPRWLAGNFIEPFFVRLPLSGAGVNVPGMLMDVRAARRTLKAMKASRDPKVRQAALAIEAQQFGGLFIGGRGATVRRGFEDFDLNSAAGKAAYGAHVLRNLPVVKQVLDLAVGFLNGYFRLNRRIERFMQEQAFGKSVRQSVQEATGSWWESVRMGEEAVRDAANGLVGTPAQQRFMEAQHDLLGKYEGWGPKMRKWIQTFLPFIPWTLAAARFVYWTMPVHHTVATAALLKISQSVQEDWSQQHADVPPGALKLAVPGGNGGWVDLARYTPYGFSDQVSYGGPGAAQAFTDTFFPQASGVLAAASGVDPFGRSLKVKPTGSNPEGTPGFGDLLGIIVNTGAESVVPLLATARRLREGGGTPYSNSNVFSPKVKPGSSHMSAVRRTFDPFRPTYLRAPTGGGGAAPMSREQRALVEEARHAARQGGGALSAREREALLREARYAARQAGR